MELEKPALTRPSLQSRVRLAARCVAVVAGGCAPRILGAELGTSANTPDGVHPTLVGPASDCRRSHHRLLAWPAASGAVAHADRPPACSSFAWDIEDAAETPGR